MSAPIPPGAPRPAAPARGILLPDGTPAPPSPAEASKRLQQLVVQMAVTLARLPSLPEEVKRLRETLRARGETPSVGRRNVLKVMRAMGVAQSQVKSLLESGPPSASRDDPRAPRTSSPESDVKREPSDAPPPPASTGTSS